MKSQGDGPRASQEAYRQFPQGSPEAVLLFSPDGVLLDCNPVCERILGMSRERLVSRSALPFGDNESEASWREAFATACAGRCSVCDVTLSYGYGEGPAIWRQVYHVPILDGDRIAGVYQFLRDPDPGQLHRERGGPIDLVDRPHFEAELQRRLGAQHGLPCALLFVRLHPWNDDQLAGDVASTLFAEAAELVAPRLRLSDCVARISSNEFAILLDHADWEQAEHVAADLLDVMSGLRETRSEGRSLAVSIGVAASGDLLYHLRASPEGLFGQAEQAAKKAERAGGDRFAPITGPTGCREGGSHSAWEHRLSRALRKDRFRLDRQPIRCLASGKIMGYEVFTRLVADDGKVIRPVVFIPHAERCGLVRQIDRWVIERTLALLKAERDRGSMARLAINLSGQSLSDESLPAFVEQKASELGVSPAGLIFEITESDVVVNLDRAGSVLAALRQVGSGIALDDFGSGFASLQFLKALSVDYLKIDGSFIRRLAADVQDQHFVEAMIQVAAIFGIRTIAEHVESRETEALLRGFGVDFVQGYHVGRPAPIPSTDFHVAPSSPADCRESLRHEMEEARTALHEALDRAGGDQSDARVQRLAEVFDNLLNRYLALPEMRTRSK